MLELEIRLVLVITKLTQVIVLILGKPVGLCSMLYHYTYKLLRIIKTCIVH